MKTVSSFIKIWKHSISNNIYFFRHLYSFSKSYVVAQAAIAIINGILPLIGIIMPRYIIDGIFGDADFTYVIKLVVIFAFSQIIISIIREILTEHYVNLNGHLYAMHFLLLINKKIVSLDMAQLDNPMTHQKLASAQDIIYKQIGVNLINSFFNFISSIIMLFSTVYIISSLNSAIVFIILIFSIFSIVINLKIENWKIKARDENIYLTRILNYYIRIMGEKSNVKEMKMHQFVDWIMKKYYETLKRLRHRLSKLYAFIMRYNMIVTCVELFKTNGIYLYLGFKAFHRQITMGEFTQYFGATTQFATAFMGAVDFITQININGKYLESYREFMEMESDIDLHQKKMFGEQLRSVATVLNGEPPCIKIENMDFSYPNTEKPVLKNVNFTFEYGKTYVIVGENGAGKSTLINLICQLYHPTKGRILLNGVPVQSINHNEYAQLFGIVFQDFKSFAFSIAENVGIDSYKKGDSEIEEKITKILDWVGLQSKFGTLPKGIDTPIDKIFDDDGIILSGGENQKMALARAIFRDTPILLLDEPSSALDPVAEDELLTKFYTFAKNKLVIYITHRMATAVNADQVIYIKNNVIHETGTHDELMSKSKDYARYYNSQAKYYTSTATPDIKNYATR